MIFLLLLTLLEGGRGVCIPGKERLSQHSRANYGPTPFPLITIGFSGIRTHNSL